MELFFFFFFLPAEKISKYHQPVRSLHSMRCCYFTTQKKKRKKNYTQLVVKWRPTTHFPRHCLAAPCRRGTRHAEVTGTYGHASEMSWRPSEMHGSVFIFFILEDWVAKKRLSKRDLCILGHKAMDRNLSHTIIGNRERIGGSGMMMI